MCAGDTVMLPVVPSGRVTLTCCCSIVRCVACTCVRVRQCPAGNSRGWQGPGATARWCNRTRAAGQPLAQTCRPPRQMASMGASSMGASSMGAAAAHGRPTLPCSSSGTGHQWRRGRARCARTQFVTRHQRSAVGTSMSSAAVCAHSTCWPTRRSFMATGAGNPRTRTRASAAKQLQMPSGIRHVPEQHCLSETQGDTAGSLPGAQPVRSHA